MLTTLSPRCSPWAVVRFFLLSTFENSFLTMKNSYHKAFVPSRRVNYYKHVEFDLRDNSPQNPVLKTSRNGYLDLRRTRKKRSYYWSMNLTRLSDYLQNSTERKSQSHLDSALNGMIRVRSPIVNESEWQLFLLSSPPATNVLRVFVV